MISFTRYFLSWSEISILFLKFVHDRLVKLIAVVEFFLGFVLHLILDHILSSLDVFASRLFGSLCARLRDLYILASVDALIIIVCKCELTESEIRRAEEVVDIFIVR